MTVLSDPDRYVHDTFTIWMFTELGIGIIASSLPTLKPLFGWFLDAARGIKSGPTYGSGFGNPTSQGFYKQNNASHKDVPLKSYTGGNNVRISSQFATRTEREVWDNGRAKHSDDSILPLHDMANKPNVIVVTKDVRVT